MQTAYKMYAFVKTNCGGIFTRSAFTFPVIQCIILLLSHPHEIYLAPCIINFPICSVAPKL